MQKGVAGQKIGVQMVSASDGSAFTGSVTVYVTGDAGTQAIGSVGSGVCTHEGNGYHSYAPDQAETNYDLIAFTFIGSGAVPVTVQVYTAINPVTAVPTAAANATAVRSELATELARIDVATSTRLASGSYTSPPTAGAIADAVWDEATVDHTSTGSTGEALSLILTAVNTLTGRIPATLFSGITYLSRWLGAIAGKTADTTTRTEINATTGGASYNETTDSLEAIRDRGDAAWTSGGGGGTSIMVTPVVAQVPVRVRDTDIETYIGDLSTIRIGIFSGEDAVDLSSFGDMEVCVQAKDGTDLDFVEMADLTIDGTDNNYVSWDPAGPSVATVRRGKWSLRKTSNKQVIAKGAWIVSDAALEDTGS